jgi:hypothetical protein
MDAKAQHGQSGLSPSMGAAPPPPSPPSQKASSAPDPGTKPTSKPIKSWRPELPNLHGSEGLTVPCSASQPMNRSQYEMILEQRLQQLVSENPDQARHVLTSSPERLPDLYQIGAQGEPKEWPSQILACGQMQTLLDQIDWKRGTILNLLPSELPTLDEISQALLQ